MNRFGIRFLLVTLVCALTHLVATAGVVIHVSPDGNDANDGSSWARAKKTIAAAISAAPANPSAPTRIYIKEGVYREWLTINAKHKIELYGGFSGTENTSDPDVTLRRTGGETAIDGQNLDRCLTIRNSDGIRLDRLTITRGQAYGSGGGLLLSSCQGIMLDRVVVEQCCPYYASSGGGAYVSSSELTVRASIFRSNTTRGPGGGLYVAGSVVGLEAVEFRNNEASSGGGAVLSGVSGKVESCRFEENRSKHETQGGGGALIHASSGLNISRTIFVGNSAARGTAIELSGSAAISLTNSLLTLNHGGRAALFLSGSSTRCDVWHSAFCDNSATDGNPAVRCEDTSAILLQNSIIAYNRYIGEQDPSSVGALGRAPQATYFLRRCIYWGNSGPLFDDPNDTLTKTGSSREWDPAFLNRIHLSHPLAYQLRPGSPAVDYCSSTLSGDLAQSPFGELAPGPRPVNATGAYYSVPDVGPFEFQGVAEQRVTLADWSWPSPTEPDYSTTLLNVVVSDPAGAVLLDDWVPMSSDGFYVLPGDWGWQPGSLYSIRVRARNCLFRALLAPDPVDPEETTRFFAFPAYNSPGVSIGSHRALIGGDLNNNNMVDIRDLYLLMMTPWGGSSDKDVDGDGIITLDDVNIVLRNFGLRGD